MTQNSLNWRISSFSGTGGSCVEMARRSDGQVLVRNSNRRAAGSLAFTAHEMATWLEGCRVGGIDDLAR
jgi:hypothetical protein